MYSSPPNGAGTNRKASVTTDKNKRVKHDRPTRIPSWQNQHGVAHNGEASNQRWYCAADKKHSHVIDGLLGRSPRQVRCAGLNGFHRQCCVRQKREAGVKGTGDVNKAD